MRLLLIHQSFVTPEEGGGTRHYEMCKYLVHIGFEITVITSEINYLSGERRNIKKEEREGIQIHYVKAYSEIKKNLINRVLNYFAFSFFSFKAGSKINDLDLVWGTSPPLFQAFSSFFLAKIKRTFFLFEVRDLWIDFAKELGIIKNPLIQKIFKWIEKFLYKKADEIMVNSPGFIPYIEKYVDKSKIKVIPNGVSLSEFDKTDDRQIFEYRKKYRLNDKFIVLYAGNIGIANDIENILEAASRTQKSYPRIIFVFFGGGVNVQQYKQQAIDDHLTNVQFFPSQPKKEIPTLLKMADVCLATLKNIPLFNTTYPNKVFDYMAAERPVVLAIDGEIRKVVEKANSGIFVPPGNPDILADTVIKYYKNMDLRLQHGANGGNYVRQNFDRQKINAEYAKFLKSRKM